MSAFIVDDESPTDTEALRLASLKAAARVQHDAVAGIATLITHRNEQETG